MKVVHHIKSVLITLFCLLNVPTRSQELKVSDFRSMPKDISARENVVKDPNGDACAIIKARTGIRDMKFTSDLEIKKIEFRDGEYWLWVPPGTHKIEMEAPGFPKIEFTLPEYTTEFNVYIIFLTAVLPETTIYRPAKTVSFISKPKNAEVFINDIFYGFTPVSINIPFETFRYRVQSKTFIPEAAVDTIRDIPLEYFFKLKKDPKSTRFYALVSAGWTFRYNTGIWGVNIGTLGKIGSSFSVSMYRPGSFNKDSDEYQILNNVNGISISSTDSLNLSYIRFALGINPRLNEHIFLSTGLGLSTTGWGESNGIIYLGLMFRTNNRVLFNISSNMVFGQSGKRFAKHLYYDSTDLVFGIGYNF